MTWYPDVLPSLSADARAILESMGDAFYAVDDAWRIIYANRRALEFWNLRTKDVVGRILWQCLPQILGTRIEAALRRARAEQCAIDFEAPSAVTGAIVKVHIAPTLDSISVYWRDITERVRSEQMLRASEEHLRLAQEAAGIGTWERDLVTGRTHWSSQMYRLIGRDPSDLRDGDHYGLWMRSVHREDRAQVAAALRALSHSLSPFSLECRIATPDGDVRWINARGNVLPNPDGVPRRMLGVNIDITERKQAEEALERRVASRTKALHDMIEALRQSRERYAAIFAYAPIYLAFMRVDPDGRVVCEDINDAYLHDSGFAREQVVGCSLDQTFTPEQVAFAMGQYRKAIETGLPVEYEFSHTFPAGTVTRRSFLVPLRDGEGRVDRILLTSVDLTETRRMEAQLRQAQKMEAIGQLTGGVAHDFNNLLTVVLGNLELLQPRLHDERSMRHLLAAQRAARRGGELTHQLLAYARRQPISPRPVDLASLIAGMNDLMQRSLGGLLRLEATLEPGLWPAQCDPTQLELMLLNLAINARDAMPGGGIIGIVARNVPNGPKLPTDLQPGDYVSIAVVDSGCGMTAETREHAFEPFFTTKEPGKGSGLGLAQVWGLAQQFGGSVLLDSAQGYGTTVQVFLPRAADMIATTVAVRIGGQRSLVAAGAILVVDDDADARDVAVAFLEQDGYVVQPAGSGQEALACLDQTRIAMVLVDCAMPGMSGTELAGRIHARHHDVPVVYVTGNPDAVSTETKRAGSTVAKPYTRAGLADAVRRTLSA